MRGNLRRKCVCAHAHKVGPREEDGGWRGGPPMNGTERETFRITAGVGGVRGRRGRRFRTEAGNMTAKPSAL